MLTQKSTSSDGSASEVCINHKKSKRFGRGKVESGLTHECGVFGAIASGDWPTTLEISQIVCWGLVALQHRYVSK